MNNKRVLTIFGHPDDTEQFCGATLLLLKEKGFEIKFLVLTDGACGSRTLSDTEIIATRHNEMKVAANLIGAELECLEIRDGCVSYDLETTRKIVRAIREFDPAIIFTHPTMDYMTDHSHTGQLVLWAVPEATHPNFEADTEAPALTLQPYVYHTDPQGLIGDDGQIVRVNTIVDVTATIDKKLEAFASHTSQMSFLKTSKNQIDSVEKTRRWAATRGQQVRVAYGEGFTQELLEQYPRKNILADILGDKVFTL